MITAGEAIDAVAAGIAIGAFVFWCVMAVAGGYALTRGRDR